MMKTKKINVVVILLLVLKTTNAEDEVCAEDVVKHLRQQLKELVSSGQINVEDDPYPTPELKDGLDYDMIIVGSGSSGSILTNRLSEIADWKILLLEAGGEPDLLVDAPMLACLQQFTKYNWGFLAEKEENFALGLENQRMHWPRGKGLGGSSLLNYMIFSRCHKNDYDRWANMGNEGWSYEDVLPYFKKLEDCKIKIQDEEYRNRGGDISVEDSTHRTRLADVFVEAAQEQGFKYVDYNGPDPLGVSYIQATTKKGLRCSGERGFVKPAKNRKNLTIRTNSHVTKVLVNEKTNTAYGVEFVHKNKTYTATASKEVILSAGVINSAHILMLSGIGPRENLEKYGIHPIHNLPVGRKIYDHPMYWFPTFTANESIQYQFEEAMKPNAFVQLYNEGEGPLHNTGGVEGVIFSKTDAFPDVEPNYPDVEYLLLSLSFNTDKGMVLKRMVRLNDEIYNAIYKPLEGKPTFNIAVILMRPESYGHMELQSSDPFIYPKIYGNFLTDPTGHDAKTLVAGIKEVLRIADAPIFKKYGIRPVETPIPGCERHGYGTDEYWECALRHLLTTVYHHTTTCKMGPPGDPESVVDNRLRVYGIKNLRVVDTSIIPLQLTGHTNVPAYMIGEKAAAMIKEDWL